MAEADPAPDSEDGFDGARDEALAAAATALLLWIGRASASTVAPPGAIPLGLVASDAGAAALWEAYGIPADPVLARIALRGRADDMGPEDPATLSQERRR